jgi:ArsR family transcriptional regulator, arsenate/arsenite/antimonite-responsive transcriptional repressor
MSKLYAKQVDRLCAMFKALSNPQRLRIFLKLAKCCAPTGCETRDAGMRRCVGELGEDLAVAASTVSHHMKELRQAGLISVARRGQKIECWISEETLDLLETFFKRARGAPRKPLAHGNT